MQCEVAQRKLIPGVAAVHISYAVGTLEQHKLSVRVNPSGL